MTVWEQYTLTPGNEVEWTSGRLTSRLYIYRSFILDYGRDAGFPGRYVYTVFDEEVDSPLEVDSIYEWETVVVYQTPGGRKQLQIQIARERGAVRKLRIQKVPTSGDLTKLENILTLNREQSAQFVAAVRAVDAIDPEGDTSVRIDDALLRDVLHDPGAFGELYARSPEQFRRLIESDADASDVVALERRRQVAATMRSWLEDDEVFDQASADAGGPEKAWQKILEENPWVLGVGLGAQLLTSWDDERLEQTVVGRSIGGVGKRADAILRTAGLVQSMVFAEVKHHRTELLAGEYRPGCWRPSSELTGAVVQSQQTVHLACENLGSVLNDESDDGEQLVTGTFLLKPRSYVIVGSLDEMVGTQTGGPLSAKYRSFELFRRNLHDPEVLTFDEVVAAAEQFVKAVSVE